MHGIWKAIGSFVRRADMILLSLCIAASVYGIVVISSATNVNGSAQYVRTQILALVLGIILYIVFTLIDVDIIAERRELLLIFSAIFILLLFPFGDTRSGNRSWLAFSFLPFSIQPAEICKIPFIMILAKTMSIRQNKISHISTVLRLAVITIFMFGLIVVASEDLGVALQYLFIFVIMAFVGGVSLLWFLGAFAVLLVASPFLWQFLSYDRRSRIWVLFDPRIDAAAQDQRYQMNRSLRALQNGGVTGQGLYHGSMVQSGSIPAQHTDLIFSSIGEELGMLGCMAVLILLTAIIIRIIYVGIKSGNYMNRLICVGIAGMLTAQVFINIGVCIDWRPVISLTLPFFPCGGGFSRHDVLRHGHCIRHQHAPRAGQQRTVYPSPVVRISGTRQFSLKGVITMKVILTQDVRGQGKRGQMIDVSDGYARNFLLPRKLAQEATADNINTMRMNDKATQERQAKERAEALDLRNRMKDMTIVVTAKGGGAGRLFGSVTNTEVSDALAKAGRYPAGQAEDRSGRADQGRRRLHHQVQARLRDQRRTQD